MPVEKTGFKTLSPESYYHEKRWGLGVSAALGYMHGSASGEVHMLTISMRKEYVPLFVYFIQKEIKVFIIV
jgi:hypothetical protein